MKYKYKHHYIDIEKYIVYEYDNNDNIIRIIDDPNNYRQYQEWIKENVPEKVSGDRFVKIVDNNVIIDPNKENILLLEQLENERIDRDNKLREEIASYDWKIIRYLCQERLVAKGKLQKTKQSEEEFIAMLEYQQSLRDKVSDL